MRNSAMEMRTVFSLCLLTVYLSFAACGGATLQVDPEAREKREAVLSWSESLRSFSGSYSRTFVNYDPRDPDLHVPKRDDITYRYEGDKKYMDFYSGVLRYHDRCSYVDGRFVQLLVMDAPPPADITSKHFVKYLDGVWKPNWPEVMICPPTIVFQQYNVDVGRSLTDYFSEGHTLLRSRAGKELLIHRSLGGSRIEIEVDNVNRIRTLLWAVDWKKDDIAAYYDGDPLDLHYPIVAWHYENYEQINGVWFPLRCEHIHYSGGDALNAIMRRRNAGELSPYEAEVIIATTVHFFEQGVATIEYDRDSLIVNQPLDDRMFHIAIPRDALELDASGVVISRLHPSWWSRHFSVIVLSAVVLLVCMGGFIAYWLRMRALLD